MEISIGPILFHWPSDRKRDFYYRIADEAPVDRVYLGELICSKRAPFFSDYLSDVVERLTAAGKKVFFSTLAEVMTRQERQMVEGLCSMPDGSVEANEAAALYALRGRPHLVGPYVNAYNEKALGYLVSQGAKHVTLPVEVPSNTVARMTQEARQLDITTEVIAWGRVGLALSARCYHARAHDRIKDNCQYACEEDPDGLTLQTLDNEPFLAINGIQTLTYKCINLVHEIDALKSCGVDVIRISPQDCDLVRIADSFRKVIDQRVSPQEAEHEMSGIFAGVPFANGFYHGVEGHSWITGGRIPAVPVN
jgi:collagenase-like PrtC family protease